jgi:D-3-phosphoglycerate dehydrogenase
MKKFKILITTSSFNNILLENSFFSKYEIVYNTTGKKLTENSLSSLIDENVVAMIAGTEPITENIFKLAKNLKFIVRCGIGIDNIDFEAAKKNNIKIYNTPDAPTNAVAELTLGLILSSIRSITISDKNIRNGLWKPIMGNLLSNKTIGIIGYGRIGQKLAYFLKPFNCKIYFHDPFAKLDDKSNISINELLKLSDIVTLHIPYNSNNHHLINSENIKLLKSSSYIINVSRGGLIDEDSLYNALINNTISGAALDCFEIEPYNGPLKNLNNVILTSHMGSYAKESRLKQESDSVDILYDQLKNI